MVNSASSLGVNIARRVSLLLRLTQYLQSKTQRLVKRTFSRVTQRPSAEKEWQQPTMEEDVQPILPFWNPRFAPLEVHAASYFAASDRIVSFSRSSISTDQRNAEECRDRRLSLGRSINSMIRNSWMVRKVMPTQRKKSVQRLIWYPPIEHMFYIGYIITRTFVLVKRMKEKFFLIS